MSRKWVPSWRRKPKGKRKLKKPRRGLHPLLSLHLSQMKKVNPTGREIAVVRKNLSLIEAGKVVQK